MVREEDKITATISGETERGKKFTVEVKFELYRPKEGDSYYGTGCYMGVDLPSSDQYVDVRYLGTTDIKELAMIWIENWYSSNAKDIRFSR